MGRGAALLAACAYLLIPMVIMQIGAQPNDVTGAGLLMAVMALASMPAKNWTGRRTALIGMGSGLVAATKLALLPSVAGVLAFTIAAVAWTDRKPLLSKSAAKRVIALALSFLFVVAPWWVRNMARYGNPLYPQGLPLIGRGVFLKDFGPIDTSFVPGPAAWPLYPLLEAHDDRSGFGALVAAGMLPGFLFLLACRRRQPFVLLVLVTVIMVPPWWVFTLHEPRFFLALIGLGFAFLPWTLLVTPRRWRRHAFVVLAAAATFSVFVTADQALVPLASQPFTRPEFYDTVWGVDPAVLSLPENEGVLFNTGYAPTIPEYAAYYPLLGEARNRVVIQLDTDASAGEIVSMMRSANIRYAYVAVAPENRSVVRNLYPDALFELVHQSVIVPGPGNGARRTLYRAASGVEADGGTQRLLFRLR
jgi:hypothetical protein